MTRKRTSLDAIFTRPIEVLKPAAPPPAGPPPAAGAGNRPHVKQLAAYLKLPVYEQLRSLAFEERSKMHDYLIEGLDLVFRKRGLPGVADLLKEGK
jgi:hypothetical protein